MITIHSDLDRRFLSSLQYALKPDNSVSFDHWIGLTRRENIFNWFDKSGLDFTAWIVGEPKTGKKYFITLHIYGYFIIIKTTACKSCRDFSLINSEWLKFELIRIVYNSYISSQKLIVTFQCKRTKVCIRFVIFYRIFFDFSPI